MKLRDILEQIRTNQVESQLVLQRLTDAVEYYTQRTEKLERDMEVVRKHVTVVQSGAKVMGMAIGAGAGIVAILKALKGI